jgi:hypothetical protein
LSRYASMYRRHFSRYTSLTATTRASPGTLGAERRSPCIWCDRRPTPIHARLIRSFAPTRSGPARTRAGSKYGTARPAAAPRKHRRETGSRLRIGFSPYWLYVAQHALASPRFDGLPRNGCPPQRKLILSMANDPVNERTLQRSRPTGQWLPNAETAPTVQAEVAIFEREVAEALARTTPARCGRPFGSTITTSA